MIPLNDFARMWADLGSALAQVFSKVGESGWYILGSEVAGFETDLSSYWGLPFSVGVASGLDALQIGLEALGMKAGDRVLTTPISAFATTLAILRLGGIPVFTDVDEFGLLDLDRCEEILSRRPEIRFVVPVHLFGHVVHLARLAAIRQRYGCRILEDSAQCIGASWSGRPPGTADGIAATSFYPTKNLGALGDGGALLTTNIEIASHARALRNYGEVSKYQHAVIGYNSRLDELHAALLRRVFLPNLPRWTSERRRIATAYLRGIQNSAVKIPGAPSHSESCWHLFPVLVAPERKKAFRDHLTEQGVATGEHYPRTIPEQPVMTQTPHEIEGSIERARRFCASEVSLPVHPYLLDSEVEQVVSAVNRWKG